MGIVSPAWVPFLRKVPIFATFSEEELTAIAKRIVVLALPKGAVLFHAGDTGDCLYVLLSGRVKFVADKRNQVNNPGGEGGNDNEKVVAYFGRGDAIGEMALLTGQLRPSTARVDSTAEFLIIFKKDFDALLEEYPSMAIHISRFLSQHFSNVNTYQQQTKTIHPSEIAVVFAPITDGDRTLFVINLGIALIEQTKSKVLLVDIAPWPGALAHSLQLEPTRISENTIHSEDIIRPDFIRHLVSLHSSGLEILTIHPELLTGKLFEVTYPFLAVLRQLYDHTLLILPEERWENLRNIIDEADTAVIAAEPSTTNDTLNRISGLTKDLPPKKIFGAWLYTDSQAESPPPAIKNLIKIPWSSSYKEHFATSGKPFIAPNGNATLRFISRLARTMGQIRLGLAMGSGAAYGYVIIGILKVLEREGIFPDVITGTSMGAILGSFYASGRSAKELEEIALTITKARLWRMGVADLTFPRSGLLIGRETMRFLKSILGDKTFEDMHTPFACVATDIVTGEEVVIKEGVVADAVRASISLPFFYQPYYYQNRYLVDGGLVNPVPTSVLALLGANLLVSANLTTKPSAKRVPFMRRRSTWPAEFQGPNIFEVLIKMIYTMQHEIAHARSEIAHVVLTADTSDFTWMEFHRASEIIRRGETCAEEVLPKIKALLPYFSDQCRVPLHRA